MGTEPIEKNLSGEKATTQRFATSSNLETQFTNQTFPLARRPVPLPKKFQTMKKMGGGAYILQVSGIAKFSKNKDNISIRAKQLTKQEKQRQAYRK